MTQFDELQAALPTALSERTRCLGQQRGAAEGEYVLYWMRTAIRTDENPALNVAIHLANQSNLPLLVYQGISEHYPFASDRHHTFVLQGARDVQQACADKSIGYALHVEGPGHRGPHLKTLTQRAAIVVTEDMPTQPLQSWSHRLSQIAQGCFLAVDTACIVPMQLVGKCYERAFEFRNATQQLYNQRISVSPNDGELQTRSRLPSDLPFEPVDLQQADLARLVSQCEIDHSIGPVPHTCGGSQAGYDRWQEFKAVGLSLYDQRRNDALVAGTSCLSPYLHYGMVSPMRVAREAAAVQTAGAAKFLDELLIWRELAYVFCHYRRDHSRLAALPDWARETLAKHQADSRESLSWETLSRGRTGDALWDAAQRSLLRHGELHNNLRMTWGKAILGWTLDAQQALSRLIDLNHRYALDGQDPASYGGILWCLGQFDRPFSPPQPIYGTVRTRPTAQHSQRLDLTAYHRRVTRPLWASTPRIAVIGAGISGLICARTLADHGCEVKVFEKSRGVAGRMSTRRAPSGLCFDHGAQYFTARDDRFQRYVQSWIEDGIVAAWTGRLVVIENGRVQAEKTGDSRYVAIPNMNSVGLHIAKDLSVGLETQVAAPRRSANRWLLANDAGDPLGEFDIVVTAVPSHQAATLLAAAPLLRKQASLIKMNGCWALMLAFAESLELGFDGAFVHQSPLSWIARNNSKPGRVADCETWVAHAAADWTETHIADSPAQITELLLDEFWAAVGRPKVKPVHTEVHRWRFAIPPEPLTEKCLFDEHAQIGACGDWCGGPRVEGAFLSGLVLTGRILGFAGATSKFVSSHA